MSPSIGLLTFLGYISVQSEAHESVFAAYNTQSCNHSCVGLEDEARNFLATAPCPPLSALYLVCQHGSRLNCQEIAAILDRCILQNGIECDVVLTAIEACVCEFNMTCLAFSGSHFNVCSWEEQQFQCDNGGSTVVTVPNYVTDRNLTTPLEITPGIPTGERTTPFIGGSRTLESKTCDVTCILVAVLGGTLVCLISAVILYRCHRRVNPRPRKTGPIPVTTVGYIDIKPQDFKNNKPHSIASVGKFGNGFLSPSFADKRVAGVRVGRPCSGFNPLMFEKSDQENVQYLNGRNGYLAWKDVPSLTTVPQDLYFDSDFDWMPMKIPRPRLNTFRSVKSTDNNDDFDRLVNCENSVFDETKT